MVHGSRGIIRFGGSMSGIVWTEGGLRVGSHHASVDASPDIIYAWMRDRKSDALHAISGALGSETLIYPHNIPPGDKVYNNNTTMNRKPRPSFP